MNDDDLVSSASVSTLIYYHWFQTRSGGWRPGGAMALNSWLGASYKVGRGIHPNNWSSEAKRSLDFVGIWQCQRAAVVLQVISSRSTLGCSPQNTTSCRCFQRWIRDDVALGWVPSAGLAHHRFSTEPISSILHPSLAQNWRAKSQLRMIWFAFSSFFLHRSQVDQRWKIAVDIGISEYHSKTQHPRAMEHQRSRSTQARPAPSISERLRAPPRGTLTQAVSLAHTLLYILKKTGTSVGYKAITL